MIEGRAPPDGLAVLRDRGLYDWVARLPPATQPGLPVPAPAARAIVPADLGGRRSPLLDLCTDLLVATLIPSKEVF